MDCTSCGAVIAEGDVFCPACGYDTAHDAVIESVYKPALARARGWILAVGILYTVSALIYVAVGRFGEEERNLVLGLNLGLSAIHVGLYFWARTSPFPAAIVALALFVTLHLTEAVIEPSSLVRGILIKILFLVALIKAVQAGLQVKRLVTQRE
ncbi:MAG: zinc ribbon domain-containing protein [Deltaproteobacteria bacterium]|nr:MAG: zinc ribbon domain-containing protein [Deltaproteobacteria bacterium]